MWTLGGGVTPGAADMKQETTEDLKAEVFGADLKVDVIYTFLCWCVSGVLVEDECGNHDTHETHVR